MIVTYYNQEQFITAVKPYEEWFNAEFMPIKYILKLPKWAKKIIYVIMNKGPDIVGFARVQPIRNSTQYLYDIQDVFIFKKYRGQKLCTEFISSIRNTAPVEKMAIFVVSVDASNMPAIRCYKKSGFVEIDPDDSIAKHLDKFWKNSNFIHMIN